MRFSSLTFLFAYLVVTLPLSFRRAVPVQDLVLLAVSLFFYGWGEPVYILIMFLSIAIDYSHGRIVTRCKAAGNDRGARMAVASSVVFNLLLLGFFKYYNFIAGSLATAGLGFLPVIDSLPLPGGSIPFTLPIGISFYTSRP